MKSVQILSFFWSVFSCIRTEEGYLLVFRPITGKCGPYKTERRSETERTSLL